MLRFVQLTAMRLVVNARTIAYSDDLLKALVWQGRDAEALNHARLRDSANTQLEGLLSIYVTSIERDGAHKTKKTLLDELLKVAFTATDELVLQEFAEILAEGRYFDDALAVARHMPDGWKKTSTISRIEEIKNTGTWQISSQTRVVKQRDPQLYKKLYKKGIVSYSSVVAHEKEDDVLEYIENQQFDEALATAKSIKHASVQVRAYEAVAKALIAAQLFEQAQEVVKLIADPAAQQRARKELATALAQSRRFDDSLQQADNIPDPKIRAQALRDISIAMARLREADRALKVAGSISDRSIRADALAGIALHLAKIGDTLAASAYDLAYKVTWGVADNRIKAIALCKIVDALAQSGDTERAMELFGLAAETARLVPDEKSQIECMKRIAATLVRTHPFDQIIQYAPAIGEPLAKQRISKEAEAVLMLFAHGGDPTESGEMFEVNKQVHNALQSISRENAMDQGLRVIASELLRIGKCERAVEIAKRISGATDLGFMGLIDYRPLADTLEDIIIHVENMSDDRRLFALLDQVNENSRRLQNVNYETSVLDQISRTLIKSGHYQKAMDAIQSRNQRDQSDWTLRSFTLEFACVGQMNLARQVTQLISEGSQRSRAIDEINKIQNENSPTIPASPQKLKEGSTGSKLSPESVVPGDLTLPLAYCQIMREFGLQSMDAYLHLIADWRNSLALQYPDAPDLWLRIVRAALEIICWVRTDWIEVRNVLLQAEQI